MSVTDYLDWNDRIAAHFFNKDMAGREVLLYVNREVIGAIGAGDGAGIQDFIKAVKEGPPDSSPGAVCEKALGLYRSFLKSASQGKRHDYPSYIAYLALFVYAGTIEGDFQDKAYYPRLYKALGEPIATGYYPGFEHMALLWDDLERWSKEDMGEELGRFTFRRRGGWVNVGIPLAQLIFSEEERGRLSHLFYQASIDPADPPPDEVLRRKLADHGRKLLSGRTRKLLASDNADNYELLAALLDFVFEELANWDGTVPDQREQGSVTEPSAVPQKIPVGMHICLEKIDPFLRVVDCRLRIKTNRQIPDDGLLLDCNGLIYSCKEAREPRWTTRLREKGSTSPTGFDASSLDWSKGAVFEDHEHNWVASCKGLPVRLFMERPLESINGWIECSQLAYNSEFMIACHPDWLGEVETWGKTYCGDLQRIDVSSLPPSWVLLKGKDATASCPGVDVLTLPKQFHLYLQGGLKTGKGNEYLHFAPPTIVVAGGTGDEDVAVNGQVLEPTNVGTCCWQLPTDLYTNLMTEIQVFDRESKDLLERRFIRLVEPSISPELETTLVVNNVGQVLPAWDTPDEESYVSGAVVYGTRQEEPYVMEEPLPFYLSHRIVFIGPNPGEVVDWPAEEPALDWKPVWALARAGRNRWVVHYCGPEGGDAPPAASSKVQRSKAVKKWKEAVWVNRRRNSAPKIKKLVSLWKSYVEGAKRV